MISRSNFFRGSFSLFSPLSAINYTSLSHQRSEALQNHAIHYNAERVNNYFDKKMRSSTRENGTLTLKEKKLDKKEFIEKKILPFEKFKEINQTLRKLKSLSDEEAYHNYIDNSYNIYLKNWDKQNEPGRIF
jgi:hypothetical protein